MDCKEFEKRIPDFINKKMDYLTLRSFMHHMESCHECKEELTIQFLIDKGLLRLEEGSAFDLNMELRSKVQDAEKQIGRHESVLKLGRLVENAVMIAFLCVILNIIFS